MNEQQQQPAAGWYPVPGDPGQMDYWSGQQWAGTPVADPKTTAPAQPAARSWWRRHPVGAVLVGLATALVTFSVVASLAGGGGRPVAPVSVEVPSSSASEAPATTAAPSLYTPKPTDFSIKLVVLKRDCFGSAGCNVVYRIDPSYTGEALTADQSFMVTYTVRGGDDPQQGSFTLTGMHAEFDSQELISTGSSRAKLTVRVDEVIPN